MSAPAAILIPEIHPTGWSGVFYPRRGKKSADNLAHYAAFFNVVEINSVFYRPGERGLGAQLAAKRTGADFVFAV
ncbi:MAG: DUF72 domain-containing protein [Chloroflexota bacterium]